MIIGFLQMVPSEEARGPMVMVGATMILRLEQLQKEVSQARAGRCLLFRLVLALVQLLQVSIVYVKRTMIRTFLCFPQLRCRYTSRVHPTEFRQRLRKRKRKRKRTRKR